MPTQFSDVTLAFQFLFAALVIFPILDAISACCVMRRIRHLEDNSFNINFLGYERINDSHDEGRMPKCLNWLKNISLYFSLVLTILLVQLVIFNSIYVSLTTVAAPVETGSLILLYITSLFSLLSFFALILKIFFENC